MPHFKEAWCSGVDFLYSIDYEGMLDQGEIGADRDVLSLGADELRLLPADTAPVGVGAVPGALFGRKTGEPLPSAVSSDPRVVEVYLGTDAHATQAAAAEARRSPSSLSIFPEVRRP